MTSTEPSRSDAGVRLDRIRAIVLDGAMNQAEATMTALRKRLDAVDDDANSRLEQLRATLDRHRELGMAEARQHAREAADAVTEEVRALRGDMIRKQTILEEEIAELKNAVEHLRMRTEGLDDFEALMTRRIRELAAADGAFMTSADVQALIAELMARRKKRRW